MKFRPIIFSSESVRAILEGRKTQTRRVVKYPVSIKQKSNAGTFNHDPMVSHKGSWWKPAEWSPYGVPGDRLWVREAFSYLLDCDGDTCGVHKYHADCANPENTKYVFSPFDGEFSGVAGNTSWKTPLFMPRWASRLTLEIVNIRVEQLKNISETDAIAEGMEVYPLKRATWSNRQSFALLWEDLNAKRGYSWNSNPWVWVVEFKKVEDNL